MTILTTTALVAGGGLVRPADPWDASGYTWTEIIASTPEAWRGMDVLVADAVSRGPVHLATGAAGSEVIIASFDGDTRHTGSFYVPIAVAAGSRLSTAAGMNTTVGYNISVVGYPATLIPNAPTATRLEVGPYNLTTAFADYGLLFRYDPGGAADTKGAYAEINPGGGNYSNNVLRGESIGQTYSHLGFQFRKSGTFTQSATWTIDVAYGASGSEVLILSDLQIAGNAAVNAVQAGIIWVPWGRSAGDRISMRAACTSTDATSRVLDVVLYGLR
jgi:hypothetical protein